MKWEKMKQFYLIILSALVLSGCAVGGIQKELEKSEGDTGLGTSPFSTGGEYRASDANAMNDNINSNAVDIAKNTALTALTGGTANALDAINEADLSDGDSRRVAILSGAAVLEYDYIYDADGTDAEYSPLVIRPDDYTVGVWRMARVGLYSVVAHGTPAAASTETFRPGVSTVTVASNFTWAFADWAASGVFDFLLVEITDGAAATITWASEIDWPGGVAPTLTTSGVDWLQFWTIDAGATVHANVVSYDSK